MPAVRIEIKGIVQGVGFRPFIYGLARKLHLCGYVLNDTDGVEIKAEGGKSDLDRFLLGIRASSPPQSKIHEIKVKKAHFRNYRDFVIKESKKKDTRTALVSPDLATCDDCLKELLDPSDRRFGYPFLNCTHCGPRLTIIRDIPYDRDKTTMSVFKMCPDCSQEYHNPQDRRFHAQPNACPFCGPKLTLMDKRRRTVKASDPVAHCIGLLRKGRIVAIKGVGGFHLSCDATNKLAVLTLRRRKFREDKPFAIMAKDLETAQRFCCVNSSEKKLLESVVRPILLLKKKDTQLIAPDVAPFQKNWGVMLPYSPLHHLLLGRSGLILVMTSGNQSDEPICYEDEDALQRLGDIADYFLLHDRPIYRRCDDSVVRLCAGKEAVIRRARGYVPGPVKTDSRFAKHILATGAQLKNTFCLARDDSAFLSTHIGDLENFETLDFYVKEIERLGKLCYVQPEVVAHDLHPDYLSTKYALSLEHVRRIPVQHHHAHIVSCMADNNIRQKVMGVAFDGTGFGADEAIWGGEFLLADSKEYQRVAHFEYTPMPGGEMAIRQPWRMAASYLYLYYGESFLGLDLEFVKKLNFDKWEAIKKILDQKINVFLTSSAGRLFDCVSVLLNWKDQTNYEGQPAVELESLADESVKSKYDFEITKRQNMFVIQPELIIKGVVKDLEKKQQKSNISAKFHNTIAQAVKEICLKLRRDRDMDLVCLSGGVFQNAFLLDRTCTLLIKNRFKVYTHHQVPPNDGGISLGQAVIANANILNQMSFR